MVYKAPKVRTEAATRAWNDYTLQKLNAPPLHGVLKLGFHGGAQRTVEKMTRKKASAVTLSKMNTYAVNDRLRLLLSLAFAFCLLLAMACTLIYECPYSKEQHPHCCNMHQPWPKKNATSHQLRGSVSHCWPDPAQRQEEYFKEGCRNRTHQSKGRKNENINMQQLPEYVRFAKPFASVSLIWGDTFVTTKTTTHEVGVKCSWLKKKHVSWSLARNLYFRFATST